MTSKRKEESATSPSAQREMGRVHMSVHVSQGGKSKAGALERTLWKRLLGNRFGETQRAERRAPRGPRGRVRRGNP